jgi:5-methylcytosine-specific restriction endonuclease McrA
MCKAGKYHATTLTRRFGSWFNALDKANLKKTRNLGITNEEYFENLQNVWIKLGRQPKYNDMQKPLSKYVAGSYEHRFGTWRKALKKFVKYVNQEGNLISDRKEVKSKFINKHKTKRSISWRMRFLVMRRDGFKCKICGQSPATNQNVILHVDHITPWSKGGETTLNNLQTLCSKCNIGKNNLELK